MTIREIIKIGEELGKDIYDSNLEILEDLDEDVTLDAELPEFYTVYTLDLRDLDKSVIDCYGKLEKNFVGYLCVDYDRIEEIEDGMLCVNILMRKD